MKRIFTPTRSPSDWQHLLAKPERHWKAGHSAMSCAAAWEHAGDRLPPEIKAALSATGIPSVNELDLLAAIPEWETPLPGGALPSFTDILAIARGKEGLCVIAVEAKANEDFGPTVEDRTELASAGQSERLNYLHARLKLAGVNPSLRYQLLHRTVSALVAAESFCAGTAVMLVHSFGNRPELFADFQRFCEAMGAVPAGSSTVYAVPTFHGPKLLLAWVDGDPRFASMDLPPDPAYVAEPLTRQIAVTTVRRRRLRRLAEQIFDHYEEGSGMDTRYFEHPFIHDTLSRHGISVRGGGRREHVVPRALLRDHCMEMYKANASVEDVTDFLDRTLWIVEISKEEAAHLDHVLGLKTVMPKGWDSAGDPFARLTAAGITFTKFEP